jgi:hypothetical protein
MHCLFTKPGCSACDIVKKRIDLKSANVQVFSLNGEDSEALAMLAYYELVALAEKQLPILVADSGDVITGPDYISRYLEEHCA